MNYHCLSDWMLFFYIYCFLGWIWESCYVSLQERKWVNRGFMHGPILPIYGLGAVIILMATLPVQENLILIFIFGMIEATLLEYIAGIIMEKLFNVRYWDYSKNRFNLNGHICLMSTLTWGGFSILMVKVLHQPIDRGVMLLELSTKRTMNLMISIVVIIDFIHAFNEAMNLKELLFQLSQTNKELQMLKKCLDEVSGIVESDTSRFKEKLLQTKQAIEERILEEDNENKTAQSTKEIGRLKYELEELKEKVIRQKERLLEFRQKTNIKAIEILRRNPHAISKKYEEAFKEIKDLDDEQKTRKPKK